MLILNVPFWPTSQDPFLTFVWLTSRAVSLDHKLTPAVSVQQDKAPHISLLTYRHYREMMTKLQLFLQNILFASAHRAIPRIVHQKISPQLSDYRGVSDFVPDSLFKGEFRHTHIREMRLFWEASSSSKVSVYNFCHCLWGMILMIFKVE